MTKHPALRDVVAALSGADPADVDTVVDSLVDRGSCRVVFGARCVACGGHGVVGGGCRVCGASRCALHNGCGGCGGQGLHEITTDGRETLEVLHTRGLWPWPIGGDRAPLWLPWEGSAEGDAPDTRASAISVAALGADALARCGEVVRESWPGSRLVWVARSATWLRQHHKKLASSGVASAVATEEHVFSVECAAASRGGGGFVAERMAIFWGADHPTARLWPALRSLHLVGAHLIECGPRRVVLAAELIP